MRIFLSIALLTVLIAAASSIETTTARQHTSPVIDPLGLTTTSTRLAPAQHGAF